MHQHPEHSYLHSHRHENLTSLTNISLWNRPTKANNRLKAIFSALRTPVDYNELANRSYWSTNVEGYSPSFSANKWYRHRKTTRSCRVVSFRRTNVLRWQKGPLLLQCLSYGENHVIFIKAYLHNALVNGISPLGHGADIESLYSSRSVSLSRWPQPSFPGPSLPNTLINEFLQLSGNLPPTIQIPSLVTLIFHAFIPFFYCGKGWTLSATSLSKQLSLVDAISHVCGAVQTISRHVKKIPIKPMVTFRY